MKKLRKITCLIVIATIILLIGQINVFATVQNTINTTNEISEDELIPALEEKLKAEQEDSGDTEEIDEEDEDTDIETLIKNAISKSQREKIEEDIYLLQTDEDMIYENTYIDGNVYIFSTQGVSFDNCEIVGNVFIISENVEIIDIQIDGSVYILSENITLSDSYMLYAYLASENIIIDEDTEIENDLNIIAASAIINGIIGRNLTAETEFIKLGDDVEIENNISIATQTYEIPKSIEKSSNLNLEIIEIEEEETSISASILNLLPELCIEFLIILIIAIIILGGSYKFTEVNKKLRLRDFFKSFFTGILEILIINIIALLLIASIYAAGYGIAILTLMMVLLYFGKAIFIISFAVRLARNNSKHIKIKAFIFTIVVTAVVELINIISVLGTAGFIVNLIFDLILGVTGFGTFVKIILTSTKKKEKVQEVFDNNKIKVENTNSKEITKIEETIPENIPEVEEIENSNNDENKEEEKQSELNSEIKENEKNEEKPKTDENTKQ